MKELITRVEELAIQAAGAQLQIDKSEAEARDLGRELGKARQKIMELVNERDHALARVPPEAWLEENKKLADRIERMEASEDIVRKSLNEEITNRDRELREMDAEAKAHREALQAKDAEISRLKETHAQDLSRIDKVTALLAVIESDATERGKEEGESLCEFLARQDAEIEKEGTRAFESGEALKAVRQELGDKTQKVLELSRWHEENLEKIKGLEAQLAHETERLKAAIRSDEIYAKECGRFDGESLRSFIGRIVGDNIHMRDELSAANQRMQIEKMKELEELVAAVIADRDRIRTELAAILAEANKSGRCNGDPVQLLRQGQADLDLLTHLESNCAGLDRLVEQLRGELAEARAQQQKADPADMKAQLRDAKQDYEIVRVQLDRIAKTAKRCGRTDKESIIDFMNRQQREKGQIHSQCKQACEQLERIQKAANETHRCGLDPVALIRKGQFDHMKIVEFRKEVVRIQAEHDALVATHSAKEVDRLSALVASLQAELEDAKRKYGDIMAALGNETPLQLIERMQRLAHDQRASTIPHDERAMLVAEIADLRKRLEAKTADHARVDYYIGCVRLCASNHGLRKGEELKYFINSKCNELAEALKTVESQSISITEAHRVTEQYTAAVEALAKLKNWASTIRHQVLVAMVHTKAMAEYDTIMKELDGEVPQ